MDFWIYLPQVGQYFMSLLLRLIFLMKENILMIR